MTMTETASKSTPRNGKQAPALADQVVLSTAGFASEGITNVRRLLDVGLTSVDTVVTGLLGLTEELATAQTRLAADLTTKAAAIARDAWKQGSTGLRTVLDQA